MSQILDFVGDAILSLSGVAFIAWLFWRTLKRSDDPPKLIFKWIFTLTMLCVMFFVAVPMFRQGGFTAIMGLFVALVWGIVMTVTWRHSLIEIIANPIASVYDGGKEPPEPKPFYSVALAKRMRGQFLEAIVAVREQLAKFPKDFQGVMLLASIQAEDMKDLPSAEMTLNHFCEMPEAPPLQVCAALTQLADWHLKFAQDTDSARRFLERIIALYPNTIQAVQAAERIAHLGGTEKVLVAAQNRVPTVVRVGIKSAGLRDSIQEIVPEETNPQKLAADYAKHLEEHPLDTEAREKLAIIYANHYQRLDLAAGELEQLIAMPNQQTKRVAHWLNLLADLQIHHDAGYDAIRQTLERVIEKFPELPVADLARSRLNHLKLEIKGKNTAPENKKLGDYEQNIGLKYGPAYGSPRQL